MSKLPPTLAVFWSDTRELLTRHERRDILQEAILESITPSEVLLRDSKSNRMVVVTSKDEKGLFCSLCKSDLVRQRYGANCPGFAKCALKGKHVGKEPT
jgi:hypothetical protein